MIQIQTNGLWICMLFYIFLQCHNGWSHTRCLFTCGSTMVSWRYMKQTIVAISSNHIMRKVVNVWLRFIIQHVQETCGYPQQRWPYMKTIVYWKDDKDIQKIHLCKNLAGLFIKSLPRRTFEQLVHKIGLRHLNDVSLHEGEK